MQSLFKKKIILAVVFFMFMILIPILAVGKKTESSSSASGLDLSKGESKIYSGSESSYSNGNFKFFTALDKSSDEILKIPDKEFLIGVVASEMPAGFEKEALKAQAVASYTYFCRARNMDKKDKNYDFTVNTKKCENYITKEQMKNKWNDNFEMYYSKIKEAVDEVFGEVIEDGSELILAAYHAISSGKTEKSADVFGGDLRYLQNVESPGDKLAPGYETIVEVAPENFKANIQNNFKDCVFNGEPDSWVKNVEKTDGGMVKKINICSLEIKGTEIRKIFGLRSASFCLSFNKETQKFVFKVYGYGHGVGMSQRGAQFMAREGKNYKEILSWYYPGTKIIKL